MPAITYEAYLAAEDKIDYAEKMCGCYPKRILTHARKHNLHSVVAVIRMRSGEPLDDFLDLDAVFEELAARPSCGDIAIDLARKYGKRVLLPFARAFSKAGKVGKLRYVFNERHLDLEVAKSVYEHAGEGAAARLIVQGRPTYDCEWADWLIAHYPGERNIELYAHMVSRSGFGYGDTEWAIRVVNHCPQALGTLPDWSITGNSIRLIEQIILLGYGRKICVHRNYQFTGEWLKRYAVDLALKEYFATKRVDEDEVVCIALRSGVRIGPMALACADQLYRRADVEEYLALRSERYRAEYHRFLA